MPTHVVAIFVAIVWLGSFALFVLAVAEAAEEDRCRTKR